MGTRDILSEMAAMAAACVYDNYIHHNYCQGIGKDARKKKKAKRRQQKQSRRNK